jgi:hypothetical protein
MSSLKPPHGWASADIQYIMLYPEYQCCPQNNAISRLSTASCSINYKHFFIFHCEYLITPWIAEDILGSNEEWWGEKRKLTFLLPRPAAIYVPMLIVALRDMFSLSMLEHVQSTHEYSMYPLRYNKVRTVVFAIIHIWPCSEHRWGNKKCILKLKLQWSEKGMRQFLLLIHICLFGLSFR